MFRDCICGAKSRVSFDKNKFRTEKRTLVTVDCEGECNLLPPLSLVINESRSSFQSRRELYEKLWKTEAELVKSGVNPYSITLGRLLYESGITYDMIF